MALEKRYSISTFVIKFLWILFLVFQESNLVICDGSEDDSLKRALEAIERRQRDLEFQENEYYGQPENIGYGFQKTLGFFDNTGPASELGSFDSNPKAENELQNLLLTYGKDQPESEMGLEKKKTNFRERMGRKNYLVSQRDNWEEYPGGTEYLQLLRNLWEKYRESRGEDVSLEDLTDEEVEEMIRSMGGGEGRVGNEYEEGNGYVEMIPMRSRKNYRVFDGMRSKRYPSFGEGMYGKRNLQEVGYENPSEKEFLYSLKYLNPELNREVERLREDSFDVLGDEKDRDVMRMVKSGRSREEEGEGESDEEPYWLEEEVGWFPGGLGRNEKREVSPRVFKNHNGIQLRKRFPVKRSTVRVRKEGVSEEVKGIFDGKETSTLPPKKGSTKKPTEMGKKNVTKAETKKQEDGKKVVRRSEKYTKGEVVPASSGNKEIAEILRVDKKSKKSIDWSQYFGLDKRSGWLKEDYLRRAEGHLMGPKSKRYSLERGSGREYEMPFDTRKFNKKRYPQDIGNNIEKVEEKIGDIEEKIIEDAVKYTGAHSGGDKEELSEVKNKVIQRLEAAYSLEKMKNALEEFKNLMKPGRSEGLRKISTEAPKTEVRTSVPRESPNLEKPQAEKMEADGEMKKRVATKKEGVKGLFSEEPSESVEFLNDMYGKKQYENEGCPVLERVLHNCLRVEEMGGRYAELLVPLCSLQQICYFCGAEIGFSKMSTCDAVYLSEARNICQGDRDCLVNARNSLLALQDLYEQDLFSGGNGRRLPSDSCLANPCIQRYFLNSPGAIYPLEIQK